MFEQSEYLEDGNGLACTACLLIIHSLLDLASMMHDYVTGLLELYHPEAKDVKDIMVYDDNSLL